MKKKCCLCNSQRSQNIRNQPLVINKMMGFGNSIAASLFRLIAECPACAYDFLGESRQS